MRSKSASEFASFYLTRLSRLVLTVWLVLGVPYALIKTLNTMGVIDWVHAHDDWAGA